MFIFFNYSFYCAIVLGVINQFYFKVYQPNIFFNYYLNDFLFPLIVLPVYFLLLIKLGLLEKRGQFYIYVFLHFILFSLWFELISPLFQEKYTGDLYDVLAYFLASIFFLITNYRKVKQYETI